MVSSCDRHSYYTEYHFSFMERIGHKFPFGCRERGLHFGWSFETVKTEVPCHMMCGTTKISHDYSKAVCAEHRSIF